MKAYAKRIGADYIYETDPAFYGGPCSLEKKYSALRPIYDNSFLKYDITQAIFCTRKFTSIGSHDPFNKML